MAMKLSIEPQTIRTRGPKDELIVQKGYLLRDGNNSVAFSEDRQELVEKAAALSKNPDAMPGMSFTIENHIQFERNEKSRM